MQSEMHLFNLQAIANENSIHTLQHTRQGKNIQIYTWNIKIVGVWTSDLFIFKVVFLNE